MKEIKDYTDAQLVGVYRQLRAMRDKAKEEFSQSQAPVLEKMQDIENECKDRLNTRENNSFNTDEGTCYKSTIVSFTAKNKTAFLDWVKKHELWDLLDIRPAKKEVEAHLEANHELPPGLDSSSRVNINFNAPRKK